MRILSIKENECPFSCQQKYLFSLLSKRFKYLQKIFTLKEWEKNRQQCHSTSYVFLPTQGYRPLTSCLHFCNNACQIIKEAFRKREISLETKKVCQTPI